uniref:Pentacotripeptide-repeat region of PRORP domain-containing protein n=1 Tax=Arundo donax TaxID=35708 RepID=A0A0A9DZA8_ARUDO
MPPPPPLLLQAGLGMARWGGEVGVSSAAGRCGGRPAPPQGRHWKAGDFPGTVDAPDSPAPPQGKRRPSEPSRSQVSDRKRHWKAGEFPETAAGPSSRAPRTPLKNVKKRLDARADAKAWACTVTEALADRINSKNWQEALQVFEMLKEQPFYHPKEGTYMKLILLLGRSGQPSRAHQLFNEMQQQGCPPTPELYTALIGAYCRSGLLDEALQLLADMKASPLCQPDVYTYSTIIKACVDAIRFDLVDAMYKDMTERSIAPNTVTQNIVLSGYGRAGRLDDMERVLTDMLDSATCKPDVWTMNIILSLFGNRGQIESMEKWYEKFRSYGIEPETRTLNLLIGAYGKKRMYDKMSAVMEYMRKLAFPWTTATYNNVIEAFAEAGDAKKHGTHIQPDALRGDEAGYEDLLLSNKWV